jgi:hypothetical protein
MESTNNKLNNVNTNTDWLSFFRISISLFSILLMVSIWKDIPNIFLENAIIKPDILDASMDAFSPTLVDIHSLLGNWGLKLDYNGFVYGIILFYMFSLVCLMIGFMTRTSALFSLLLQIILIKSMHYFIYGVDYFQTMALFYCFIFPVSRYSVDEILFKNIKISPISLKWSLRLLQCHLGVVYFFSGLDKGLGVNWYNGESIWRAVSGHNYNGIIALADYNINSNLYMIAGIMTLVTEFCYPLFINMRKTRLLWVTMTVGMHLSIIIFMGLYFFGALMIILNLSAYYFPYVKNKKEAFEVNELALN